MAVVAGRHLLAANSASDFAAECVRLMDSSALASNLAARAHRLFLDRYSLEAAESTVLPRLRLM
ncbi:MAG: hypothetical protein ACYDAG_07255 [Chloroflexota bacterium]